MKANFSYHVYIFQKIWQRFENQQIRLFLDCVYAKTNQKNQ